MELKKYPSELRGDEWVQFNYNGAVLRGYIENLGTAYATVHVTTKGKYHKEKLSIEIMKLYEVEFDISGMDYSGMIDLALATNDVQWFKELKRRK